MQKVDAFETSRLLLGLNCFEPGQSQKVHKHPGADKFYLVLSGKAKIVVGDRSHDAAAGDLVLAPADVEHGVETAYERTVMLIGMTK
jgi:quercetin dioxygenase-like cupin family protein